MIWLPDGNVLIALVLKTHQDHARARAWFCNITCRFATCSVTQGTLLRLHMMLAKDRSATAAWQVLRGIETEVLHDYIGDDLPYREVPHGQLHGHRQVTDAWIVELAHRISGKVATLDTGMVTAYPNDSVLI